MKKVLLATTALVASTGFAAAQGIELSGTAQAGVASEAGSGIEVFDSLEITFTMTGMTDNGLEFGTDLDLISTTNYSFDIGDFEFDGTSDTHHNAEMGGVWISSGGLTVTFDNDGTDDLVDDDNTHDIQVGYASGPLSLDLTHDVDGSNGGSSSSFSAGYDQDGISASIAANDEDDTSISAGYASGSFSVGITLDDIDGSQDTTLEGSFSADAFTLSAETSTGDSGDTWEIGLEFSQDNVSVSASFDDASAWEISGSMDAGGGLSFVGGINSLDSYYLGAEMSF